MKKIVGAILLLSISMVVVTSCGNNSGTTTATNDSTTTHDSMQNTTKPGVTSADWGESDGKKVLSYTLTNKNGVQVKITNYGGTVTSWITPDRNGNKSSIVLGFDNLQGYLAHPPYFGALIGRYGNRIANGKFTLNGKTYTLATNNGKNALHGGLKGF